ncbi:MAG: ethylbenzene dehydrogenase-related protein [Nitrospirota bacterium]
MKAIILKRKILINLIMIIFLGSSTIVLASSPSEDGGEKGSGGDVVFSKQIEGSIPAKDPMSPLWDEVAAVEFPTSPQVMTEPRIFNVTAKKVKIRSLHNGKEIAFLMEFDDPKKEDGDAAALEFMVGDKKSHFAHALPMVQVEGGFVNIWQWKAGDNKVKDLYARGYINAPEPHAKQNVTGAGVWKDNKWHVVFSRPFETGDEKDVVFKPAEFRSIAFATWDASNREKGSQHSFTAWRWMVLESTIGGSVYIYALLGVLVTAAAEAIFVSKISDK